MKEESKEVIEGRDSIKTATSLLNKISKQHHKAKDLLSEATHDLALLKAILKYEKKTTTRPEEVYILNIKKKLYSNLDKLGEIYEPKSTLKLFEK